MVKRTGVPTILGLAKELCSFLAVYIPIIEIAFPDEEAVIALLKLLQETACALVVELQPLLEPGD